MHAIIRIRAHTSNREPLRIQSMGLSFDQWEKKADNFNKLRQNNLARS